MSAGQFIRRVQPLRRPVPQPSLTVPPQSLQFVAIRAIRVSPCGLIFGPPALNTQLSSLNQSTPSDRLAPFSIV